MSVATGACGGASSNVTALGAAARSVYERTCLGSGLLNAAAIQCGHGVGHGVVHAAGRDVDVALGACARLGGNELAATCATGATHSFFNGLDGRDARRFDVFRRRASSRGNATTFEGRATYSGGPPWADSPPPDAPRCGRVPNGAAGCWNSRFRFGIDAATRVALADAPTVPAVADAPCRGDPACVLAMASVFFCGNARRRPNGKRGSLVYADCDVLPGTLGDYCSPLAPTPPTHAACVSGAAAFAFFTAPDASEGDCRAWCANALGAGLAKASHETCARACSSSVKGRAASYFTVPAP